MAHAEEATLSVKGVIIGAFIAADGIVSLYGMPPGNAAVTVGRILRTALGVFLMSI